MLSYPQSLGRLKSAIITMAPMLAIAAPVSAQGSGLFIEEILVTARKQTESIQDIPLSINAYDAAEIERQAIESTEDVVRFTPGLTFTRGVGGQDLRPDIRGLTPLSGRANVAILVDGVDMTTDALNGTGAGQLISLGLFDLERVEVVRGPQSALFGRNAFGGAINYITKKPSAQFEGAIDVDYDEWDSGKVKIGLSGPVTDELLYRVYLASSKGGSQWDNSTGKGEELGADRTQSASFSLQFLPLDGLEILRRIDYSKKDANHLPVGAIGANGCVTNDYDASAKIIVDGDVRDCASVAGEPASAYFIGTAPDFSQDQIRLSDTTNYDSTTELLQSTLMISYEFAENYTFFSNSSVTDFEGTDVYDLDYSETTPLVGDCTPFFDCAAAGLPFGLAQPSQFAFPWVSGANPFAYVNDRELDRVSLFQDFRLSFDDNDGFRWLIGLEYAREDLEQNDFSRANSLTVPREGGSATGVTGYNFAGPFPVPIIETLTWDGTPFTADRDSESWGLYGGVDWMFADAWELSASFRYQEDKFDLRYDNANTALLVPALINPAVPETQVSNNYYAFNPRFVLSHYYSDNIMFYGSVAKGTKPGGHTIEPDISAAVGANPDKLTYDQEKVLSYELGWKTSWMNDRLLVNGAVFYMDDTDKQANRIDYVTASGTPRGFVDNIGESHVTGLELQITGVINKYWTASFNYAYIQTEIDEYLNFSAPGVPSPAFGTPSSVAEAAAAADPDADQSGNELPYTPKHNAQLSNNLVFDIAPGWESFVQVDTRYMSSRYTDTNNLSELPSSLVWDIKVGVSSDQYELTAYLDNAFDEDSPASGVSYPDFTKNFRGRILVHPRDKRTFGIRMKYNF